MDRLKVLQLLDEIRAHFGVYHQIPEWAFDTQQSLAEFCAHIPKQARNKPWAQALLQKQQKQPA